MMPKTVLLLCALCPAASAAQTTAQPAATLPAADSTDRARGAGAKLCRGERDVAEGAAGVILGGRYALLVGQAVFACLDEELAVAHQSDDREKAKRNRKITAVAVLVDERAVDLIANECGDITATAATVALACLFKDPCTKHNGFYNLYNCRRNVMLWTFGSGDGAISFANSVAFEYTHVAFSAK